MAVRVLCAGDIHIGRRSTRVHDVFRSADAWRDIVDKAIELDVDLVALSGDIIDEESKSYEALGPMQHGLHLLDEAGINTVAVAGNHDFDVLVRLDAITGTDRFHLLGEGGQWERFTLTRQGAPVLHIDGWSFASGHVRQAPLHSYMNQPDDGVPVMGLLHGDLGVNNSLYAPVNSQDLWARPFAFTLLGHIHMPEVFTGPTGRQALYPGSPYALDPGEPGIHGCWIAEFESDNSVSIQQIPLSPVLYASIEVDLIDLMDETDFQDRLLKTLTSFAKQTSSEVGSPALRVISARVHFVGQTATHRLVDKWIEQARSEMSRFQVASVYVEVDKLTSSVRPPINLQERAQGTDPVAEAAKIILALDADSPPAPYSDLVESTLREMESIHRHSGYAALRSATDFDDGPGINDAKDLIGSRAWEMLSSLVSQEEEA